MTYYPPTLLPPSLPYISLDAIMDHLCDQCLAIQSDDKVPEPLKQQYFDLTMELLEFWDSQIGEGRS